MLNSLLDLLPRIKSINVYGGNSARSCFIRFDNTKSRHLNLRRLFCTANVHSIQTNMVKQKACKCCCQYIYVKDVWLIIYQHTKTLKIKRGRRHICTHKRLVIKKPKTSLDSKVLKTFKLSILKAVWGRVNSRSSLFTLIPSYIFTTKGNEQNYQKKLKVFGYRNKAFFTFRVHALLTIWNRAFESPGRAGNLDQIKYRYTISKNLQLKRLPTWI